MKCVGAGVCFPSQSLVGSQFSLRGFFASPDPPVPDHPGPLLPQAALVVFLSIECPCVRRQRAPPTPPRPYPLPATESAFPLLPERFPPPAENTLNTLLYLPERTASGLIAPALIFSPLRQRRSPPPFRSVRHALFPAGVAPGPSPHLFISLLSTPPTGRHSVDRSMPEV